jgi:hypothetical protein
MCRRLRTAGTVALKEPDKRAQNASKSISGAKD